MKHLYFNPAFPISYLSCGILESDDGFVHPKRNIDSHVLILVQHGVLHITQNNSDYHVSAGQFLLLPAGTLHYGTQPSEGQLSYFWTHFTVTDPHAELLEVLPDSVKKKLASDTLRDTILILLEYGTLPAMGHSFFAFSQLIHTAKREGYRPSPKCSYAAMLLLLDVYTESMTGYLRHSGTVPPRLAECFEWIRHHYDHDIHVSAVAARFQYNPAYLTTAIKKYTGLSFVQLLNQTRIAAAKNLLANSELTIEAIAKQCGFWDEKYFYRIFKKEEQMTPNEYRKHLIG